MYNGKCRSGKNPPEGTDDVEEEAKFCIEKSKGGADIFSLQVVRFH